MKRFAMMFAAALSAAPAVAQFPDEERSVSIPLAGIRLGDPESLAALKSRIARAAIQVCAADDRSLSSVLESQRCRSLAVERSNQQLTGLLDRSWLSADATPRK